MTRRRCRTQSRRRLIGSMPTPMRSGKSMRRRRRRLRISGDPLSPRPTEEHRVEEECPEEWAGCPTWETLEEPRPRLEEMRRDPRLTRSTKGSARIGAIRVFVISSFLDIRYSIVAVKMIMTIFCCLPYHDYICCLHDSILFLTF